MEIKSLSYKGVTWHNALFQTDADLSDAVAQLREKFHFHELALEDCMSPKERPKVDVYDGALFIVLHLPRFNKETKRIETREVEMFVGPDYIITIHNGSLKPLERLYERLQSDPESQKFYLGKGSGYFLYEIISELFTYCFPILDKMSSTISALERDILSEEGDVVKDHLRDILLAKRNIIRFRRIILPMRSVIVELKNMKSAHLPTKLEAYFDDTLDQVERMWDLLTSYKELIEALQDTNQSIIASKTKEVVKVLTVISVVLLPPTFITGLYGMNVDLPWSHSSSAFVQLCVFMLGVTAATVLYFKLKKWM